MRKTTVYLSDEESDGLRRMAAATGRSQAALIREAVRRLTARPAKRVFHSMGVAASGSAEKSRRWDADELYRRKVRGAR